MVLAGRVEGKMGCWVEYRLKVFRYGRAGVMCSQPKTM